MIPMTPDKNGRSLTADDPQDGIGKKQQNIGEQEHGKEDNAGYELPRHHCDDKNARSIKAGTQRGATPLRPAKRRR